MSDLISRKEAIEALRNAENHAFNGFFKGLVAAHKIIADLPSAELEQPPEIQDILNYLDTVLHPIISPEYWDVYSELHDMISTLPSAEPEHGKWIPVIEKYPIPWELVWVTDKRGHVSVCQMSHKENQYWYDGEEEWMYEHDAVVAWMPYYVPEPYRGDK